MFPLAVAWISRYTSVIIFVTSSTLIHVVWVLIRACRISWKLHLTGKTQFLKYWLTVNSIKINKFAVGQTRSIGLFQKKKNGGWRHTFLKKPWNFSFFYFTSGNSRQNKASPLEFHKLFRTPFLYNVG